MLTSEVTWACNYVIYCLHELDQRQMKMCSPLAAWSSQVQNIKASPSPALTLPAVEDPAHNTPLGTLWGLRVCFFSLPCGNNTGEIWCPEPPNFEPEQPSLIIALLLFFFQRCANCVMLCDHNDVSGRCSPFHVPRMPAGVKTTRFPLFLSLGRTFGRGLLSVPYICLIISTIWLDHFYLFFLLSIT